jgi:hypothetical protein
MTARPRQILACSGVLYPPQDAPPELVGAQVRQAVALCGAREPRVCFVPTAVGDSPLSLERWYASAGAFGGAELSHLQLFTQPNVPDVRAHLLAQDVIWVSGGSVVNLLAVWRAHRLDAIMRECWEAGFLPFSNGVHDDLAEQPRRRCYRELVGAGTLGPGYATEDGVALHYVGTELREAVAILPGRSAWHVTPAAGGGYSETPVPARYWLPPL